MSDDLGMLLRTAAYLAFEDGTNDYTTPALAAARIAELEAALRDVLPYVDTCNSSHREAQAKGYVALEGGKDE